MNTTQLMNARSIRRLADLELGIDLSDSTRLLDCADAVTEHANEQVDVDQGLWTAQTPEKAIELIDRAADVALRRPFRQEHAARLAGLYGRNAMGPVIEQREVIADAIAAAANEHVEPLLAALRQLPSSMHMLEGRRLADAGLAVQTAFNEAKERCNQIAVYDQARRWLFDVTGLLSGQGVYGVVAPYCTVRPGADVHTIAGAINEPSPLRPWHRLAHAAGVESVRFTTLSEAAETIAKLKAAAEPVKAPMRERVPDWSIAKAAG